MFVVIRTTNMVQHRVRPGVAVIGGNAVKSLVVVSNCLTIGHIECAMDAKTILQSKAISILAANREM
jgi:hypothetical protein